MNYKTFLLPLLVTFVPGIAAAQCASCAASLSLPTAPLSLNTTPGVKVSVTDTTSTISFKAHFTGLPSGFAVANGDYQGWCPDFFGDFNNNNSSTSYTLISTYNTAALPLNAQSPNWDKVNWVLNHKSGHSSWAIQQVIWGLLAGQYGPASAGFPLPQPETNNLYTQAMTQGAGFVPQTGQIVGVLMYVDGIYPQPKNGQPNTFQEILIEVKMPACAVGAIGDFVWNDLNDNGIQESGEPGINGVTVRLEDQSGNLLASTVTANAPVGYSFLPSNSAGYYQFKGLCPGTYQVAIDNSQPALTGLTSSPVNAGSPYNPAKDSNPNAATVTLLNANSVDETIDFGYYAPAPGCTIPASAEVISSTSWNKFNIPAGTNPVVWVHAQYNPKGVPTSTKSTVRFTSVSFVLNGTVYPMPDGLMTFDPGAPAASSTVFNAAMNRWETLVNPNYLSDENFMTGAALPAGPLSGGGQATIHFTTQTADTGLNFPWQWSAAVFTNWPGYNQAAIQPYHGNGLHADTPTNSLVQHSLIQGPRGGGGSNYTGSWSATGHGTCPH